MPDSYTSKNLYKGKSIEFADDDYYYFLHVKKYISKGSVSPLEMVSNQIHSIIINKRKIDFLKHVEMDLYQNALAKNYVQYEKISFLIISFQFFTLSLMAQEMVEGIVAVIGDKAILKSEVEQQYLQLRASDVTNSNLRCEVMEELMFQKLLSHHAEVDSLVVTDDEVNDAIDQRIEYFISQIGSEKKLEEYFDKSISQIREEFQTIFREQRLAQRMESKITQTLKLLHKTF